MYKRQVLGQLTLESTQYGREELTVAPIEGANLADQLAEAVQHIEDVYKRQVYMVMQLRHDEKIFDERFASMRELHRRGKTPDPEHYEVTYYTDLPAMWQDAVSYTHLQKYLSGFGRLSK